MIYTILGAALVCFSISGCVSTPMLQSMDHGFTQVIDTDTTGASQEDLAISLTSVGEENGAWTFNVTIRNTTDKTIKIRPRNMFFQLHNVTSPTQRTYIPANRFDNELAGIQKRRDMVTDLRAASKKREATGAILDLVEAVLPSGERKTQEALDIEKLEDYEQELQTAKLNQKFENSLQVLDVKESFWKENVLKDSDLSPGEIAVGFVRFPIQNYRGEVSVILQFYPYRYIHKFEQ